MKRAFTLIEMMIVVAILAILMTITFRLTSSGDSDAKRAATIVKMQKIENCLSGYYAAFGCYPPVKTHNSRDIYLKAENGNQTGERKQGALKDIEAQVQLACRAQPFGCQYPPSEAETKKIDEWRDNMKERISNKDWTHFKDGWCYKTAFSENLTAPKRRGGGFEEAFDDPRDPNDEALSEWSEVQLFEFGVMSYLLPRYLVMMRGGEEWFGDSSTVCKQWSDNNEVPSNPFTGESYNDVQEGGASGWKLVWQKADSNAGGSKKSDSQARRDQLSIENMPSQAVCARWMPNLAGLCATTIGGETYFGIDISEGTWRVYNNGFTSDLSDETKVYPPTNLPIHTPPGGGKQYCNGWVTITDGWGEEFFYYSPAPYQSYVLWSSGPNGKTFPPWVSLDNLSAEDRKTATEWMADDIKSMSEGR